MNIKNKTTAYRVIAVIPTPHNCRSHQVGWELFLPISQ